MKELIVGFSHHRLEVLPHLKTYLEKADLIILEEPASKNFESFLKGEKGFYEALKEEELGFPEYTKELWNYLKKLYQEGKEIFQIEPYLSGLKRIYEEITANEKKEFDEVLQRIYDTENRCTGKLLEFYESTLKDDFETVINRVIDFSREDAKRFKLRDEMRAQAILENLPDTGKIYIEAGTSHLHLLKRLSKNLKGKGGLKVVFLLGEVCKKLTGKTWIYPPGELLTLKHILGHKMERFEERLLSARALIFIKIIPKEELRPNPQNPYPHLHWELSANFMVEKLSFEDCKQLYKKTFFVSDYEKAFMIVKSYFLK
ncbi:MAG: hypothetical protein ABWJ99_08350 [Caldimicrobium sp.]